MPEEAMESKAQKLAAARKKLKEYQSRNIDAASKSATTTGEPNDVSAGTPTTTGSIASNLSERSESELNLNGNHMRMDSGDACVAPPTPPPAATAPQTAASYFQTTTPMGATAFDAPFFTATMPYNAVDMPQETVNTNASNLNAIQVLIAEKGQLTAELNKCRNVCRERDLELEEVRTQYTNTTQRLEDLQNQFVQQQQQAEQLRKSNAELQHKLAQRNAHNEDQQTHVQELQKQLGLLQTRVSELEQQHTDKCNELEMSQLRIRQLTDETNISADNRVETLTQTQYMYEQQIRDLQAMVQQLTQDKEQANTQYQNYVQHLNAEVSKLNERNGELNEECTRLLERETQLVEHVSALERDIQKNLHKQAQLREQEQQQLMTKTNENEANKDEYNENKKLHEQLIEHELDRHEFQLKIKSQDDHLLNLQAVASERQQLIDQLQEQLDRITAEQPDHNKLLATMESDKVAASRALSQNVEMKQQLDELQMRFIQLTNEKADLMNQLDTEKYSKRELNVLYESLEERVSQIDERFKFKDEEMIRLSHENMELTRKNMILQQQIKHQHWNEAREPTNDECVEQQHANSCEHAHDDNEHETHRHADQLNQHTHCTHDADQKNHEENSTEERASLLQSNHHEHAVEAKEINFEHEHADACTAHPPLTHTHSHPHADAHAHDMQHRESRATAPYLPTSEAVDKLQQRFTKLMSQVADLTDEKQRLEHLVLQLQSETETIGEYITLYQTQRRMLKQREYEKAAQMQLLQVEREQMREKITVLNNLVSSLGVELPKTYREDSLAQQQQRQPGQVQNNAANAIQSVEGESVTANTTLPATNDLTSSTVDAANAQENEHPHKLNSDASQLILNKIQNIITEIKENTNKEVPTVRTVDHLNCCLGKFEVV